jgi:hypothetical protein
MYDHNLGRPLGPSTLTGRTWVLTGRAVYQSAPDQPFRNSQQASGPEIHWTKVQYNIHLNAYRLGTVGFSPVVRDST